MTTILVAVKAVPLGNLPTTFSPSGDWSNPWEWQLDPINQTTLEWAVARRDAAEVDRVVAASVGREKATTVALRAAQARGADALIAITTEAQLDVPSTARLLARVAHDLTADVVVFGYESFDGSSGTLPAATAAALGWPVLSRIRDGDLSSGALEGTRSLVDGIAPVTTALPAVVSFVEGVITPRNPSLAASMAARRAVPKMIDAAEVAGDQLLVAWTQGLEWTQPVAPRTPETVTLDLADGVQAILNLATEVRWGATEDTRT